MNTLHINCRSSLRNWKGASVETACVEWLENFLKTTLKRHLGWTYSQRNGRKMKINRTSKCPPTFFLLHSQSFLFSLSTFHYIFSVLLYHAVISIIWMSNLFLFSAFFPENILFLFIQFIVLNLTISNNQRLLINNLIIKRANFKTNNKRENNKKAE